MLSATAFEGASQAKPRQFKDQGLKVTPGSINNVHEWLMQLVCLFKRVGVNALLLCRSLVLSSIS